jgi:hypothetical protein
MRSALRAASGGGERRPIRRSACKMQRQSASGELHPRRRVREVLDPWTSAGRTGQRMGNRTAARRLAHEHTGAKPYYSIVCLTRPHGSRKHGERGRNRTSNLLLMTSFSFASAKSTKCSLRGPIFRPFALLYLADEIQNPPRLTVTRSVRFDL